MRTIWSWLFHLDRGRRTRDTDRDWHGDVVFPGGALLIAAFVAFRAWTLYPSWFYADDQRLLIDARTDDFGIDYLMSPFDSQFMPVGRLVADVVAGSGDEAPSWSLAVSITLVMLALAGAACLAMLVVAFGRRWEVLPLLTLFLFSTTALPATMWWAASLNQLPLLIAWCGSVAAGLLLLRTRRVLWAVVLAACLAFGLLAYIKTLLVIPVLAWLALSYFSQGSLRHRLIDVARRWWRAAAPLLLGAVVVAVVYRLKIPQPFTGDSVAKVAGPLADRLIGTSWATSAVGGPWRWQNSNPPVGVTAPPDWAAHAAWLLLAGIVLYAALRRHRTGRAWGLLALCLLMDYLLLLITRAPFFGAIAGNEMRYLTESAVALSLVLGLVFLPVRGAVESSEPRRQPLLSLAVTPAFGIALTVAVVVSSIASTSAYVRTWHTDNPGEVYLNRVTDNARALGSLDLVDGTVPDSVMAPYTFPYNTLRSLVPLRAPWVDFPEASPELRVVTTSGDIRPARIDAVAVSRTGPMKGCGWRVKKQQVSIPLDRKAPDGDWWMSIGYLANDASTLTVRTGDSTVRSSVISGLGTLFVHLPGSYDRVMINPPDAGVTLCVDRIVVGAPTGAS